jgi:fructose-1,6-bisphosphatase I
MQLEETFMHFLLQHQQKHGRTLNFLILMESILTSARYIQHYYNLAALHGNVGESGEINIQGENVMRLDTMANQIALHYLEQSKQVIEATSEETPDPVKMNADGRYLIYFDPLDGSSNVKHSLPVGFLFGIAKRNLDGNEDLHLRSGKEFIAAGMFLIPSGIFTFALKNAGAWQFLRDESGVYIRPTRVELPSDKANWELSWNSSNRNNYGEKIQKWISKNESAHNFRYAGSLAVDFHRLLHNGGLFMYPAIVNHPDKNKNRPDGKLRLIYECAVIAFIAKEAGGVAINELGHNILDVNPKERHERSTLFVGCKEIVEDIKKTI